MFVTHRLARSSIRLLLDFLNRLRNNDMQLKWLLRTFVSWSALDVNVRRRRTFRDFLAGRG